MIIKQPFAALFDRAPPLLALTLLVMSGAAFAPAALAGEVFAMAEAQDATRQTMERTETYTVSSGGVDVIFAITHAADGAITAEARTWMLLPDEHGYRAFVTERKGATGEFVETARGELYDPDADGVPDAIDGPDTADASPDAASPLDQRPGT